MAHLIPKLIQDTLTIQVGEISGEDYPDQAAEYRLSAIQAGLTSFVARFAQTHTESSEEEDQVLYYVAMHILERFQIRATSNYLASRLKKRMPVPTQSQEQANGA